MDFPLTFAVLPSNVRINRYIIFPLHLIEFIIGNSIMLFYRKIKQITRSIKVVEPAQHATTKSSIFLIVIPNVTPNNNYLLLNKLPLNNIEHIDDLIALKNILYIDSPLMILVTVITLLVGLIGAAVLSRYIYKFAIK